MFRVIIISLSAALVCGTPVKTVGNRTVPNLSIMNNIQYAIGPMVEFPNQELGVINPSGIADALATSGTNQVTLISQSPKQFANVGQTLLGSALSIIPLPCAQGHDENKPQKRSTEFIAELSKILMPMSESYLKTVGSAKKI